jgi:hypothetical protein
VARLAGCKSLRRKVSPATPPEGGSGAGGSGPPSDTAEADTGNHGARTPSRVRQPRDGASCRGRGCARPRSLRSGIAWVRSPRVCRGPRARVGRRGKTRQARGRPSRLLPRLGDARDVLARQTAREPRTGTPQPRRRPAPHRGGRRVGPGAAGRPTRATAGRPTASRASDPPRVLGGRASRPRGEGADRPTQPAQSLPWTPDHVRGRL